MAARASARVCATDPSRLAKWGMTTVRSARNQFGVRQFGRWRWRSSRCVSAEKDLTGSGDIGVEILMSVTEILAYVPGGAKVGPFPDRKSTRLNSSHLGISYAVF